MASRPTQKELYEKGKDLRNKCPRRSHAAWKQPQSRRNPVQLVEEANLGRIPELVPIRHGRMMQSPFTFYRGTALNMASDVMGHRLMQSASDIFLGWTEAKVGHYYVRQLKDVKINFEVEQFNGSKMIQFAEFCGSTLARAHARSGEPAKISGYLGKGDVFDKAIAGFSVAYADQTEHD